MTVRLLALVAVAACAASASAAYCMPSDPCWPGAAAWQALNATVSGGLIAVLPEAAPCAKYGEADPRCQAVLGNWSNPFWRAAQPGAMQVPVWEQDAGGGGCLVFGQPCVQGDIPPFAVKVSSPSDVSAALAFGAAHNIRVIVKSSGHEFQGRSTAAGALMVWMHTYTGVTTQPAFSACEGDAAQAAVTVLGGTQWGDVYDAVRPEYVVVGGSSRSVCACGGFVLGGGHSFMSPSFGLAADNVLAFDVVLANGTALQGVSPCVHANLFWALRGGGGAFAVITSVTYRLYPAGGVVGLSLTVGFRTGAGSTALFLDGLLAVTQNLSSPSASGGVWSGYASFLSAPQANPGISGQFVFNGSMQGATTSLTDLYVFLKSYPADLYVVTFSLTPFSTFLAWHDTIDPAVTGDRTGASFAMGSWLVPLNACTISTARSAAVAAFVNVSSYVPMFMYLVAGGAVSTADPSLTSVSPAWRQATWHAGFGVGWGLNTSAADIAYNFQVTSYLNGILRDGMPTSGAYWMETDYLMPSWQSTFWGTNYPRLLHVKAVYDPNNVFMCHHCVGDTSA